MPKINVTAKGDFGYHPASGMFLRDGKLYSIDEADFSDQLFNRVADDEAQRLRDAEAAEEAAANAALIAALAAQANVPVPATEQPAGDLPAEQKEQGGAE